MERLYFIKDIKKSGLPCNYFAGIKKYVATGDVENNRIVSFTEIDYKSKPSRANVCVSEGDVLFAKMQNTIKVIQIDTNNSDIVYSTGFYCFNDKRILPSFLKHYFLSKTFNEQKDKRCNGATMKAINDDGMSELFIKLYSLAEQKKMIKILDGVNAIIDADKRQIELLDELVKSRFIEMFGNVLNNDRNWETQPMKLLCKEIGDGLHGTPEYDINGEYYFINGNNLEEKRICIKADTKRVSESERLKHFIELDCNTVLISINGTFGKTAFYNNEKVILGKSACYLKLKKMLNKEFVLNMFGTDEWMQYMEENSTGTTIKNFGLKAMRDFRMIVPPIELQNEFAEFVKLIDKSKFNIQQHIKLMQELLDKMMCEYFGGNE